MSSTSFLRFAGLTLFLSLGALVACSGPNCDHSCPAALPTLLSAPKPVSAATSSTTATCGAAVECGADGGDCTTVRVVLFAPGQCEIAVTYVDGTSFTFVSNVSQGAASCCANENLTLDATTLGT